MIQSKHSILPQDTSYNERYFCHDYDRHCRRLKYFSDRELTSDTLIPTRSGILLPQESGLSYSYVGSPEVVERNYRRRVLEEVPALKRLAVAAASTFTQIQNQLVTCEVHMNVTGRRGAKVWGYDRACLQGKIASLREAIQIPHLQISDERMKLHEISSFYRDCGSFAVTAPGTLITLLDPDCVQEGLDTTRQHTHELLNLLGRFS